MRCFVALGSNSNEARSHLEFGAARLIQNARVSGLRFSTLYTTPALLPEGAPAHWNKVFFNAVCEFEWKGSDPYELLALLKSIESECGVRKRERWSPRALDLDLLLFGQTTMDEERLKIPHPELTKRSFVLDSLAELAPSLTLPGGTHSVLQLRRRLKRKAPSFMNILNLTHDSFSDGGGNKDSSAFHNQVQHCLKEGVQYLDLGAESTRPGASELKVEEEWERLEPYLVQLFELKKDALFFPKISIDTYKPEIAARALELGVDIVNDVGAGRSDEMLKLVAKSRCDYICMHSLTVPAEKETTLPFDSHPMDLLLTWVKDTLKRIEAFGVSQDRVILDPGIGFGKTAQQSLQLLQNIDSLLALPVRILVGHSRKSFMSIFSNHPNSERNPESIGISMRLGLQGVEVLRVHEAHFHQRSWIACHHLSPQHEE